MWCVHSSNYGEHSGPTGSSPGKLQELERRVDHHDINLRTLFEAIKRLMVPLEKPRRQIGFQVKESAKPYRANVQPGG